MRKSNKLSWECHTRRYKLSNTDNSTSAKVSVLIGSSDVHTRVGNAKHENMFNVNTRVGTFHMKMCSNIHTRVGCVKMII